jgi:hypothetical protein
MTHSSRNLRLSGAALGLALVAAALPGCTRQVSTSEGDGVPLDPPPFSLAGDAPWPAPYSDDPLWLEAARGDDIDRARLAQRETARMLLTAIERGGSLGRTALRTLEFAADRLVIQADLCGLAVRAEATSLGPLMEALLEALSNAPRNEETEDARADAECLRVFAEIQQRPNVSSADRDLAQGAARRIEAR